MVLKSILFFVLFYLVTSCAKEKDVTTGYGLLNITPAIRVNTKTLVDNNNISQKEIGIHITNSLGSELFPNSDSYNLCLKNNGQNWMIYKNDIETNVILSQQEVKIFAYYPFTEISESLTGVGESLKLKINIPQTMVQNEMTDYLWGSQSTTISNGTDKISWINSNVQLLLKHAGVLLAFVIYKDGYDGNAKLEKIEIRHKSHSPVFRVNKEINNDLSLLLANGSIIGGTLVDKIELINLSNSIELEGDPGEDLQQLFQYKNAYFLIPPASFLYKNDFELLFKINGIEFLTSLTGSDPISFESGNLYIIKVKITMNQIFVCEITEWNEENWNVITGSESMISNRDWEMNSLVYTSGYDPWGCLVPVLINHGGEIGSLLWAPRNAGYKKDFLYGLTYQWHRRCGQTFNQTGYEESPSCYIVEGGISKENGNLFINRNNFYKSFNELFDWCFTQESSWSIDALYNPCPFGWRVPTSLELSSLLSLGSTWVDYNNGGIDDLSGRWYGGNHSTDRTGSVFLPASGKRNNSGNSVERGVAGYYWTSTISGNDATALFFNSLGSSITNSQKVNAFSVRCVRNSN